jgi:hypothetical protein
MPSELARNIFLEIALPSTRLYTRRHTQPMFDFGRAPEGKAKVLS